MSLLNFIESSNLPKTDKYDLGYFHEFYSDLFTERQFTTNNILEIGIHLGFSLLLWRDFFINAHIYGVDVNYCPNVDRRERITPYCQNAYSLDFVNSLPKDTFDIIIDDGPHTFESMVFFCENYLPLVKKGGLFILEDIIDINWTPKLIEIIGPDKNIEIKHMAGLAKRLDLKIHWQNGLDVIIVRT